MTNSGRDSLRSCTPARDSVGSSAARHSAAADSTKVNNRTYFMMSTREVSANLSRFPRSKCFLARAASPNLDG